LTKKIADFDLKYEALFQAHGNLRTENERLNKYIKYLLDKFSEKIETLNIISLKKIQTETVKIWYFTDDFINYRYMIIKK
jgi:hypothetical protein